MRAHLFWPNRTWRSGRSVLMKPSARSCRATRAIPTHSIASRPDPAEAPPPRSPPASAWSGWAATPAIPFAGRPRINRWSGIRSTMGLTSRAGVSPLSLLADIAGPIARTVEDAEKVFQVIVGADPERSRHRRRLRASSARLRGIARSQRPARRDDRDPPPSLRARIDRS